MIDDRIDKMKISYAYLLAASSKAFDHRSG